MGRNFYPHREPTIPYPQKILCVSPQDSHTHRTPKSYISTYPYSHPVFSLQEAYFNLLFVTLTVGYYMMYVLCESVCD